MTEFLIIWFVVGVCFAGFLCLGAAKLEARAAILGAEIPQGYIVACLLIASLLAWPVVLWLVIDGRLSAARDAMAREAIAQTLTNRVNEMAEEMTPNPNAVAVMRAKDFPIATHEQLDALNPNTAKGRDVL